MNRTLWMKHNIQIVTELIIIKIPLRLSIECHCICCCSWCCVAPLFHERIKCFFKQKMFIAYKYFIEYKEVFGMCVFFALCFFFSSPIQNVLQYIYILRRWNSILCGWCLNYWMNHNYLMIQSTHTKCSRYLTCADRMLLHSNLIRCIQTCSRLIKLRKYACEH